MKNTYRLALFVTKKENRDNFADLSNIIGPVLALQKEYDSQNDIEFALNETLLYGIECIDAEPVED